MKVAIVHDWLLGMRGGERCLEVIGSIFPQADIYTLFYDAAGISESINRHRIVPSSLNFLPGVSGYYRHLLPFYDLAVRDLSRRIRRGGAAPDEKSFGGYDLVISVSHCVAKNIRVPDSIPHLCYCLTPMRYLWDQYDAYFEGRSFEPAIRRVVNRLRQVDVERSGGVTRYVAISRFIRDRILRCYNKDSLVVYPPVKTDWIESCRAAVTKPGSGFLCVSALVPYKNVHLIVEAFNRLQLPLTVIGSGPEAARLKNMAGPGIRFIDRVSDTELAQHYSESIGMVFAAVEDFGMVPVEMQAAGRPVIALGVGGALETVVGSGPNPTGIFFPDAASGSIISAIDDFMGRQSEFSVDNCIAQGRSFSSVRFVDGFIDALDGLISNEALLTLRQGSRSVRGKESAAAVINGAELSQFGSRRLVASIGGGVSDA